MEIASGAAGGGSGGDGERSVSDMDVWGAFRRKLLAAGQSADQNPGQNSVSSPSSVFLILIMRRSRLF
jgi:hypothetical protein